MGVAAVVLPGTASAATDCSYAGGGPVVVWVDGVNDDGGVTGDGLAGACVDTNTDFDGGYVEVGRGDGTDDNGGSYAVIDGSEDNPAGNAQGYGALSTYESRDPENAADDGSPDPDCDGNDDDSASTNSGGCLWIKAIDRGAPVPLISCGLTSGPDFVTATRDGCSI
jgi:hypothetical protein